VLDSYLRARFKSYRGSDRVDVASQLTPERYHIAGGDQYAANVQLFLRKYAKSDGLVLERPLSPSTRALVDDYVFALVHLAAFCRDHGARLVLVYFPCYPQVYDPGTPMTIRDILRDASARSGIPFLDLTPAFREAGRGQVLHLAPRDFHPNPAGNAVIARGVADFLAGARR